MFHLNNIKYQGGLFNESGLALKRLALCVLIPASEGLVYRTVCNSEPCEELDSFQKRVI
jgi:hypothetical protein